MIAAGQQKVTPATHCESLRASGEDRYQSCVVLAERCEAQSGKGMFELPTPSGGTMRASSFEQCRALSKIAPMTLGPLSPKMLSEMKTATPKVETTSEPTPPPEAAPPPPAPPAPKPAPRICKEPGCYTKSLAELHRTPSPGPAQRQTLDLYFSGGDGNTYGHKMTLLTTVVKHGNEMRIAYEIRDRNDRAVGGKRELAIRNGELGKLALNVEPQGPTNFSFIRSAWLSVK